MTHVAKGVCPAQAQRQRTCTCAAHWLSHLGLMATPWRDRAHTTSTQQLALRLDRRSCDPPAAGTPETGRASIARAKAITTDAHT